MYMFECVYNIYIYIYIYSTYNTYIYIYVKIDRLYMDR